jgi:hypothetical protein
MGVLFLPSFSGEILAIRVWMLSTAPAEMIASLLAMVQKKCLSEEPKGFEFRFRFFYFDYFLAIKFVLRNHMFCLTNEMVL